MEAVELHDHD